MSIKAGGMAWEVYFSILEIYYKIFELPQLS